VTRVSLLTPPGRGGIALLEVAGSETGRVMASVFRRPLPAVGALAVGPIADEKGPIDEVLVARVAEDKVEIGLHGGPAVARRALAALSAHPACNAHPEPVEGESKGPRAEAQARLPLAETELAAKVLLAGLAGELEARLEKLPLTEAALEALVDSARLGIACSRPPRIALVGAPNAGKSTLFNALLGTERAIVSPEPGTTRDALEESCSLGGVPVRFVDLAGIRESADEIEQAGVARSREHSRGSDLRLVVIDLAAPLDSGRFAALARGERSATGRTVVVLNKRDLLDPEARSHARHKIARELPEGVACIEVSAKAGTGLEALKAAVVSELVGSTSLDRPILYTERQRAHASRALAHSKANDTNAARAAIRDIMRGEPWPEES
jgi:tRNA modification GTPase